MVDVSADHVSRRPWGRWRPAPPRELAALLAGLGGRWWVAGGYALELATGRSWRAHGDADVAVPHREQLAVQRVLTGWQWWAARPPGRLRPWRPDEVLPEDVHDIWCRPGPGAPWRVQIMLERIAGTGADERWTSRRDPRVHRPLPSIHRVTPAGIPYLAPEVQLYYKAKSPRAKDEADFTHIVPAPPGPSRAWLAAAITSTYGPHPWRAALREPAARDRDPRAGS